MEWKINFLKGENAGELLCIKEAPFDKIIYIYIYIPAKFRIHAYKQGTNEN